MAPEWHRRRLTGAFTAVLLAAVFASSPARALRLVDYNLLNYPGSTGAARDPHYRTVLAPLLPDMMVTEETNSQAGVDEFLGSVLNTLEPGQWSAASFINGNDTDCGFFWKPSKVQFLGQWAFYPNPSDTLRLIHVYRVKPVGYASTSAEIRLYALHLKASSGSANATRRAGEAHGLRDTLNALPPGVHAIAAGDFNFYSGVSSTEPGLDTLTASHVNNTGRLYDPLGLLGITWQDNASIAFRHTQSPCLNGTCASGASTGGLDDRFDLLLPTYNWNDGQGLELLASTYVSVGNDGLHLNKNITDSPTIPEGSGYATALISASDHLPLRVDLSLPAQIGPVSPLAFGTVIVGAAASQNVAVADTAHTPADSLRYTLAAGAGFSAPAGNFAVAAGDPPALHAIGLSTATAGVKAANLTIASNDLDYPTTLVALSGTVLDHASASLDSTAALLADTVDFGDHNGGGFSTETTRVHNRGYNALQARLSVTAGAIAGGASRFSIAGGFSPALLAGIGQSYGVDFNDAGTTADSTYYATLTFTSADEALPGATAQPNLVVTLRARRTSGTVAVEDERRLPTSTRLYAPSPNPLFGASTLRFDLARAAQVRLEVFDLAGRRVATIAEGPFDPGQFSYRWDGRNADGGTMGAGLYFIRLSGRGLATQTARLAIVR